MPGIAHDELIRRSEFSDWVPNPEVERTIIAVDRRVRRQVALFSFLTGYAWSFFFELSHYLPSGRDHKLLSVFLPMFAIVVPQSIFQLAVANRLRKRRGVGVFDERASPDDQSQAEPTAYVFIEQDGVISGSDFGTIAFLDGCLMFQGLRSSFSLRPQDVGRPTRGATGLNGDGLYDTINLSTRVGDRSIRIRILVRGHSAASTRENKQRFDSALQQWASSPPVTSRGILPPLAWDVTEWVPSRWMRRDVLGVAAAGLLAGGLYLTYARFASLPLSVLGHTLLAAALACWMAVLMSITRRRKAYLKLTGGKK